MRRGWGSSTNPRSSRPAGGGGPGSPSADSFPPAPAGTFPSPAPEATWTVTPAAPLHGGATSAVRVTTAQKDARGIALAAQFQSGGFITAAALAVGIAPSGTAGVRPGVVLTFNRSVDQSSVVSIES